MRLPSPPKTPLILAIAALSLGLSSCGQGGWPPKHKGDESLLPESRTYGAKTNPDMESVGFVYFDESKAGNKGWAIYLGIGQLKLGNNLFAIDQAKDCYVENQFEVIYYDDSITVIKLDPDQKDKLLPGTLTCNGAVIRYRDQVFTLKADGWYEGEKRLHAF